MRIPGAAQTICGQAVDGETPRATLTLDGISKTTAVFGRDTRPETLNLLFAVNGCQLDPNNTPRPSLVVRPKVIQNCRLRRKRGHQIHRLTSSRSAR